MHYDLSLADLLPLGVIVAAWNDIIPSIAAVFAIGWYCILMWESDTVRGWTNRKIQEDNENPDDMTGI